MEMKYEAVFGPQELFIDAKKDTVVIVKYDDVVVFFSCYSDFFDHLRAVGRGLSVDAPVIAMRRIVPEPKRWTVEDQKAGRLPEVGIKCVWVNLSGTESPDDLLYPEVGTEIEIVANTKTYDGKYPVSVFKWLHDDGETQCYAASGHAEDFKPIESPEEKAARLRSEWCNRAMDCSTIQQLYDAMLSGELPVPAAPEQNK